MRVFAGVTRAGTTNERPSPASTSRAGHCAGRIDAQAARVRRGRTLHPRAPQPAPPALVTGRRPCKGARCTLLVRRGVWIQEIPADAVIPLMWRESFFAVCLIRRRGNCGIAAMVRIIVAKVRRVRAFLNWDNEMIRFRSEANLGPISKVGRGAKRGVRRTSLNPGYDLGSPINSETRVSPHAAAALAASAAGLAAV